MPTESTVQTTGMKSFMGRAPALDGNGFIADMAFKLKVQALIVDTTITVEQSGTFFTTEGATEAAIVATLPAPTATGANGCVFFFFNAEDITLTVTSGTADLMVAFDDVAATSVSLETANEVIGSGFMIVGDGAKWFALPFLGADSATVTVA